MEGEGEGGVRFLVRCYDSDAPEKGFDAMLPRAEVRAELLEAFEKGLLVSRGEHGNKKPKPAWVKGHRQLTRWLKSGGQKGGQRGRSSNAAKKPARRSRKPLLRKALPKPTVARKFRRPAAATTKRCAASFKKDAAERPMAKGWLQLSTEQRQQLHACGVDKLKLLEKARRCTGGILTAVLSCGLLADWTEIIRGESIEHVYIFALKLHRDAQSLGMCIAALGYDNACKLLLLARSKAQDCLPWTQSFVEEIRIVLDRFHRDNHTWCLANLPEVDPSIEENADLLQDRNTEACEQLNSWISGRTHCVLEMTRGHFQLFWWILFDAHNRWLEEEAECKRRRYARGGLKHDPDKPKHRTDKAEA